MQNAVSQSLKPNLPILVTETGITPANDVLGTLNNTYKALWWFEVLMSELCVENVSFIYNWGTHSPWRGPADSDTHDADVLLRIDTNERKPTGEIIRIVNDHILDRMVDVSVEQGYVRAFATADNSGQRLNILLMNKNDAPEDIVITLRNDAVQSRTFRATAFAGTSPEDRNPRYQQLTTTRKHGDTIKLQLPPLSVTVLAQDM